MEIKLFWYFTVHRIVKKIICFFVKKIDRYAGIRIRKPPAGNLTYIISIHHGVLFRVGGRTPEYFQIR